MHTHLLRATNYLHLNAPETGIASCDGEGVDSRRRMSAAAAVDQVGGSSGLQLMGH